MTQDLDLPTRPRPAPLKRTELARYFGEGFKKEAALKVGIEWEKIGVWEESGRAIPYSGPRGVEAIFEALIGRYGWRSASAGAPVIALEKNSHSITLEPGGQIELSGRQAAHLEQNAAELDCHLKEIRVVSGPLGITWLALGAQPVSAADEIEWVPKQRYRIMRESLKGRGALTYSMMKETASIQISLDYTSEADAAEKLRLAMGLSPFLAAMFANSPFEAGKKSSYLSRRSHIWAHTAPERAGILWDVFERDFGFEDYVEYALDVPLLFIVRGGRWLDVQNRTFRQFLKEGWEGASAGRADWELHLTSLFTEARLKHYLEIRSIDCQEPAMGMAAAALLKGIFYDETSRRKAWDLIADIEPDERKKLMAQVPAEALKAHVGKKETGQIASDLLRVGEEGLKRLAGTKLAATDEPAYLVPLKKNLKKGLCPAEVLLAALKKKEGTKDFIQEIIRRTAI